MSTVDVRLMRTTLTSERLVLRPFAAGDGGFLQDLFLDEVGGRYLSDPPRSAADDTYLRCFDTMATDPGCAQLIACARDTGERIGNVSVVPEGDDVDIGISVRPDHWRRGYATEMLRTVVDHCAEVGLARVRADVADANVASTRMLLAVGFVPVQSMTYRKAGTQIVYDATAYVLDLPRQHLAVRRRLVERRPEGPARGRRGPGRHAVCGPRRPLTGSGQA